MSQAPFQPNEAFGAPPQGQNPYGSQGNTQNAGKFGSPDPMTVKMFHLYDDTDAEAASHHHTIGPGVNQAASGAHVHNGNDSPLLLEGVTLSGTRGTATAMSSVIAALVQLGATDQTTA